jgi:hypothetical protein
LQKGKRCEKCFDGDSRQVLPYGRLGGYRKEIVEKG